MKKAPKPQSERFKEAARELGVELDEDQLRETLRKVAPVSTVGHASDCAVHNEPANAAGECDCARGKQ